MRTTFVILGIACLWPASAFGQAEKLARAPLLADGQLQQVRSHISQILAFTFEGAALRVDRAKWGPAAVADPLRPGVTPASPVETIFRQIQTTAGLTSSSMSIGGRNRTILFTGRSLHGRLELRDDTFRMTLEEAEGPQRSLEVTDDGQGSLRIQMMHPDGDMVMLNQSRKGPVTAVAITGGQVFAAQGDSFVAFLRQHRDKMETQLLPVLGHHGIQPVLSLQTPQVRQAVLAQLLRSPETLAEGKRLIVSLDSTKFEERERAMKKLNAQFENYKDLIEAQLRDKSSSLEVYNRLQKLVAEHGDSVRISQTVAALELAKDARFVVSLLDHVSGEDRSRVVEHLEKMTGQKLGADVAAWKDWAQKQRK